VACRVGEHVAAQPAGPEFQNPVGRLRHVVDHDVDVELLREIRVRPPRRPVIGSELEGHAGSAFAGGDDDPVVAQVGDRHPDQLAVERRQLPRVRAVDHHVVHPPDHGLADHLPDRETVRSPGCGVMAVRSGHYHALQARRTARPRGREMATIKQTQAAKRNVRQAQQAASRKKTTASTARAATTAPGKQGAAVAQRKQTGAAAPRTKAELYEMAKKRDLPGRSKMGRDELAKKLGVR
jgi:hypothetical protein